MGSKNSTMSPGSFSKNNSKAEVHPYVESMAKGIITNRMVAEPYGVSRTQSFWDSLSEIPCIISEINEEAVKSVLDCLEQNKDMRKNKDLLHLVKLYYSNSFIMSQLCNELENCLTIARDRQLTLRAAVQFFKEEQGSWENKNDRYVQALEELKKFKNAENPFSNFSQILKKVREQQQSLCDELGLHYKSIKMKLVILKVFRGVCRAIFWLINFAIVVCQVVLPFAGHNDLAAALGSAGAGAGLSALGGTVDLQFKSYHNELSREMELISSIEECARGKLNGLGEIHIAVDRLEKLLQSLMRNAEFALEGEVKVKLGFEEIEKNMYKFMNTLDKLNQRADECSKDLEDGRSAIQAKMKEYKCSIPS